MGGMKIHILESNGMDAQARMASKWVLINSHVMDSVTLGIQFFRKIENEYLVFLSTGNRYRSFCFKPRLYPKRISGFNHQKETIENKLNFGSGDFGGHRSTKLSEPDWEIDGKNELILIELKLEWLPNHRFSSLKILTLDSEWLKGKVLNKQSSFSFVAWRRVVRAYHKNQLVEQPFLTDNVHDKDSLLVLKYQSI